MYKRYEKSELVIIVAGCNSYREVLVKLNRNESGGSYRILKKLLVRYEIDVSHFTIKRENIGVRTKYENNVLFTKDSIISRACIKKRIINDNLLEYKCVKCGNKGEWLGEKITLILDHINGVNNDNRLENLRFLCPNCNSTLPTHCLGSKGLLENKVKKIDGRTVNKIRLDLRKVEWPTELELNDMIKNMSYCAIGRKYGVSDNTVRKWVKRYNIISECNRV